jgi:cobalt-zinc-cadmium efflux system membrane fusion protein
MRILSIVIALIALCSCRTSSTGAGSEASSANKKPESSQKGKEAGIIVLDQTTQQKGHIVVASLQSKQVPQTLTAPGQITVNEDRTWRVGAIAAGKIDDLTARVGDLVHSGQVLGHIHSHDVHEARAAYREAFVELERARTAERYVLQRRDRAKKLLDLKAGSRQDLESAEAEVVNAQAQIEKAQSELNKERIHLTDVLRVLVDDGDHGGSAKPDTQDDIPIFAPAAGIVFERKATVGSVVTASDELFSITDTSSLWMIAAANEGDLSALHAGQSVRIQVRAYPEQEFNGHILKLGEQLDPTTRTLQVRILVPNRQHLLKPEMYATASLEQAARRSALFLPAEAVQDISGVPAVFVRRSPQEFEVRTVKTGQLLQGETEILEGLQSGEAVVVKGSFLLKSQLLKSSIQEE